MADDEIQKFVETLLQESKRSQAEARADFERTAEMLATAVRQHFDVSTEAVRHEVQLIAEGVVQLGERVSREIGRLDEKVDRGFADTQAMIRFSHAELEKRVRALEDGYTDVRSRLDRLEDTPH